MSSALIDQAVIQLMRRFPEPTSFLIAFSGGMDSSVMLHALSRKIPSQRLKAIYIDHGLQAISSDWAQHCAQICEHYSIPFQSIRIQIASTNRQGIESTARQKRYQVLSEQADSQTVILTAHHQRDQVETLLLNLARGAGVTGLAAMPKLKTLSWVGAESVRHYRPLLEVPYVDLKAYAQQYQLDWVEDMTNTHTHFRRNYIRHEILPKFNQAWSFFEANAAQSAQYVSEGLGLLDELAEMDFRQCSHCEFALQFPKKMLENSPRVKNLIRYWVRFYQLELKLNQSIMQWIEQIFEVDNPQSQPQRKVTNGILKIYQTTLFFYQQFDPQYRLTDAQFSANGLQFWNQSLMADVCKLSQVYKGRVIQLRPITADDKDWISTPLKLKHWFKQYQVPVWDRQRWPVIEVDGKPVGVLGFDPLNDPPKQFM